MLKWMAYKLIVRKMLLGFFFLFALFLIGKLWMKSILNFRLIAWKYLLFKNEKIWKKKNQKKTKLTKIN